MGAVALLVGTGMITVAIRGGVHDRPRNSILLIAGMMAAAFGLVLGGFAIAYSATEPLDLNTTAAVG